MSQIASLNPGMSSRFQLASLRRNDLQTRLPPKRPELMDRLKNLLRDGFEHCSRSARTGDSFSVSGSKKGSVSVDPFKGPGPGNSHFSTSGSKRGSVSVDPFKRPGTESADFFVSGSKRGSVSVDPF
jgi:hypothetical protein